MRRLFSAILGLAWGSFHLSPSALSNQVKIKGLLLLSPGYPFRGFVYLHFCRLKYHLHRNTLPYESFFQLFGFLIKKRIFFCPFHLVFYVDPVCIGIIELVDQDVIDLSRQLDLSNH